MGLNRYSFDKEPVSGSKIFEDRVDCKSPVSMETMRVLPHSPLDEAVFTISFLSHEHPILRILRKDGFCAGYSLSWRWFQVMTLMSVAQGVPAKLISIPMSLKTFYVCWIISAAVRTLLQNNFTPGKYIVYPIFLIFAWLACLCTSISDFPYFRLIDTHAHAHAHTHIYIITL